MAPDAAPLSADTARQLASRITVTRQNLARLFDAAAAQLGGDYVDFKLAALGAANDHAAFAAALGKASERSFLGLLIRSLIETGGIDVTGYKLGKKGELILSDQLRLTPQDANGISFTPQGWKQTMTKLIAVHRLLPALTTASRRVCSVEVDGVKRGSGFLVGPQTVLTNWHVVHTLFDLEGDTEPESHTRLRCLFDYLDGSNGAVHAAVPGWCVDWSPLQVGNTITGSYPDLTSHKPHALDYCVIRLAGGPGRARGWYDLTKAGTVVADNPFFVVQHPDQLPQRLAVARDAKLANGVIEHMALTLGGSSGGLCLNDRFELAGLHQGQVTGTIDGKVELLTNRAIPAHSISPLCGQLATTTVDAYDTIWVTRRNKLAVLGRSQTLSKIAAMSEATTTTPILVVQGKPGAGKRFTIELLEDRLAGTDFWIARLDAANLPAGAREVADLILERAEIGKAERAELSTPEDAGTTEIAWIREPLFREFAQIVEKAANGRPLWIVIENLDRIDIVPSAARSFLDVLYAKVAPPTPPPTRPFRVVLLGLNGGAPAGDPNGVLYEQLADPDLVAPAEIATFLACVCAERGLPASTVELNRLAGLIDAASPDWPSGGPVGQLARVGNLLSKVVYPNLK